jgi:PilZ domain
LNCNEKRKMDRFSLELPAWISAINDNGSLQSFEVVTRDICAAGAFLQTDQPLSVGTDIEMNLVLPLDNLPKMQKRRSRIDVSGSVVRTELQGMAVSFDKRYQISPVAG